MLASNFFDQHLFQVFEWDCTCSRTCPRSGCNCCNIGIAVITAKHSTLIIWAIWHFKSILFFFDKFWYFQAFINFYYVKLHPAKWKSAIVNISKFELKILFNFYLRIFDINKDYYINNDCPTILTDITMYRAYLTV